MTLLITVFAAVICTAIWYKHGIEEKMNVILLVFLFWGASIMWFVDAVSEYLELGSAYFTPNPLDMLNDTFLGLSVVALALVIWIVVLLIKDPLGHIKQIITKKHNKQ